MPPVQGNGKTPNIANPNLPTTTTTSPSPKSPSSKPTSSVAGSADPTESAATTAKDNPAKAIEKLETRTKAVNTNNVARVANSHLISSDAKLHPLVSLRTGKPLEKFPETSAGLGKLTLVSVDNMLNALDAERSGSEAAKREKLRVQIGLKPNPA